MRRLRRFRTVVTAVALAIAAPGLAQESGKTDSKAAPTQGERNLDLEALLNRERGGSSGGSGSNDRKYRDFNDVTKGAKRIEGLFTLHWKDEHLYAEIRPHQFDQPMLAPITIARGIAQAGIPLDPFDEMVLVFHKAGDRVQLIRRNIHYKAPANTPIEKAVRQNYTDSILMSLPIVSVNRSGGNSTLIDLSDIFMSDFAQLGLGSFDKSRSNWSKVKAFPNNIELEVEATFGGGRFGNGDDDGVVDSRGVTVVVHYSLMKTPAPGYRPRMADDRVGHFLSASKDFGQVESPTAFVRMVNRWRLEKADSKAKLSAPKKQIIFYVEDTVPFEYRSFVEEGIREWNKAFEKIGFRDAIAVRWQQPGEEFDPEDADHCTFRWITTNRTYAMSCLRANPMTGELIDGDVIFDASWIRAWKDQYALLTGIPEPKGVGEAVEAFEPVALGEVISPILADKMRFGLPGAGDFRRQNGETLRLLPAEATPLEAHLAQRLQKSQVASCQFSGGMQMEMSLALLAMADEKKEEAEAKLPEELIGQAIKEVTMHEVGHSLGLRHNFKASTMLSGDQLNDTSITRSKGNTASVMDYTPINLAPRGQKQGDYFTTTIGPYDYWAIEYAYRPIDGNEESELRKIAARAPEDDLIFATDEDMYGNNDPLVNTYDLGSDVCRFARNRMALASNLLKDLDDKTVKDGESWARNRRAFSVLLSQYGDASHLLSSYIAGQEVSRDHKGDKDARDPVVPIPGPKQREALEALVSGIFSDKAFAFSPETLRRLGVEKWSHWGSNARSASVDFPVLERVLSIQRIALSHCLSGDTLGRLENQQLQVDASTKPLKLSELFSTLTDGIFRELNAASGDDKTPKLEVSTIRRNLQREYLNRLTSLVLGPGGPGYQERYVYVDFGGGSAPADARALARLHLKRIRDRIGSALDKPGVTIDDTTRAHLESCHDRIGKVLDASLQAGSF